MNVRISMSIAAVLLGCLLNVAVAAQHAPGAEAAYARLQEVERASASSQYRVRAQQILAAYRDLFAHDMTPEAMPRHDDASLTYLFKAAYMGLFYTDQPELLGHLHLVLDALERRALATEEQRAQLYRSMIGLRRFDEARAYLSLHPRLPVEPVPTVAALPDGTPEGPVVYAVQDGPILQPRRIDLARGRRLVVVAHPLCGFSRAAMEAVSTDPAFAEIRGQTLWLAPPDQRLYLEQLQAWNRDHPAVQVVLARRHGDWPELEAWATPEFYLFRDGQLVGRLTGWPKEGGGRRDALLALLSGEGDVPP